MDQRIAWFNPSHHLTTLTRADLLPHHTTPAPRYRGTYEFRRDGFGLPLRLPFLEREFEFRRLALGYPASGRSPCGSKRASWGAPAGSWIIHVSWSSGVQFNLTTLNLDDHVGNLYGELVWGHQKFNVSCKDVRLEGTLLVASCDCGNKQWKEARLDLEEHITYTIARRCFEAILHDPAFTEMMSSAAWMNVAVITQPDMRGFLKNPAFQETIKGVARRAVEEVINEMREEMSRAVERAVSQVSIRAEEHVQYEIQSLTKRATLNTAAYSGLGGLTVMSHEQTRAYNTFGPFIGLGHGHLATMKGTFSHLAMGAMGVLKGGAHQSVDAAPAIADEETQKSIEKAMKRLDLEPCSSGFPFIKKGDGYRCNGGTEGGAGKHFISFKDLGLK
ncbi:hypothetical protein B0H17DRAFT_1203254 [Mycena rosella]|uniref:Cyanovirin-N domain-containing protein n=1 Tax=Mycena rosella TaxID=1033263 RepID=A0AAD7GGL4_MYCRO|nr:hypothetical protein B0H17DRAFT_1203254 [Mycena rosella]